MGVRQPSALIGGSGWGSGLAARALARPLFVLFTDLDGTLLDTDTYGYDAARPALARLREHAIPVILCTSKTRAEVEPLRRKLGNQAPFIVENGGALYAPAGYFRAALPDSSGRDGYRVIEMGVPYSRLREGLRLIEEYVGVSLIGFGDMTAEHVARVTGLARREAEWARQREYDEPFLVEDSRLPLRRLCEAARCVGLTVIPGGRFFHLVGGADKGRACRVLIDCYRREWGTVSTAGVGGSLNDVPMLESVEWPFLVERPGGGHVEGHEVDRLTCVRGSGPVGWARAVEKLLKPNPLHPAGRVLLRPFPPSMC